MEGRFSGRAALITGGGSGIGAATARRLASEGAGVVVMGRTPAPLEEVTSGIAATGGTAFSFAGDVTDRPAIAAAVALAVERFGRLDFLVTSAGGGRDRLIHKMTEEDWDQVVDTHLKGTFLCVQAAQGAMAPNKYGRMVFLSSASVRGSRGQLNYSAAKAGVQAMAKTLALELGPFGITVNTVVPGFIDTVMTRGVAERTQTDWEELEKMMAARTALNRIGTPDDVAGVIAFLCSDDAAFVTGQNLWVRGGP